MEEGRLVLCASVDTLGLMQESSMGKNLVILDIIVLVILTIS